MSVTIRKVCGIGWVIDAADLPIPLSEERIDQISDQFSCDLYDFIDYDYYGDSSNSPCYYLTVPLFYNGATIDQIINKLSAFKDSGSYHFLESLYEAITSVEPEEPRFYSVSWMEA